MASEPELPAEEKLGNRDAIPRLDGEDRVRSRDPATSRDQRLRHELNSLAWPEIVVNFAPRYLIKGVLGAGELSVLVGQPGCGKTFLALDLALHIAQGNDWAGHRVRQATVVHVAGEGGEGIKKRIEAFRQHHGLDRDDAVPFFLLPRAVNLLLGEDVEALITEIRRIDAKLAIIDTLARAMPGGDENAPGDMTLLVAKCDQIREETGTHILLVHHTPKTGKSLRGHSSLLGAVDTAIMLEGRGAIKTARIDKQKDGADGDLCAFTLEVVELGEDQDGDAVTSCVVHPVDAPARSVRLSKQAQAALEALREAIAKDGQTCKVDGVPANISVVRTDIWHAQCGTRKIATANTPDALRVAVKRASNKLQDAGIIGISGDWVWIKQ